MTLNSFHIMVLKLRYSDHILSGFLFRYPIFYKVLNECYKEAIDVTSFCKILKVK